MTISGGEWWRYNCVRESGLLWGVWKAVITDKCDIDVNKHIIRTR